MPQPDNKKFRIDLHVHCSERSKCAVSTEIEQIETARKRGLNGIAITDHRRLVPEKRLAELKREYAPFWVVGGIELGVTDGEEVLVLGIQDPILEEKAWSYAELHSFVSARGGYLGVAHPFRYHPGIYLDLDTYRPHGIEVNATSTPDPARPIIRSRAARYNIPLLHNSDAHTTKFIGMYHNVFDETPEDENALLRMLKAGAFTEGQNDEARDIYRAAIAKANVKK